MNKNIPLDFFYNGLIFNDEANDVRKYLVTDVHDSMFMYFTLLGSGYIDQVDPYLDDQLIQQSVGYDCKVIDRLKSIEKDGGLNVLLHDMNLDYEYKYADGYQDKLAIVALAIYKASV